MISIDTNLLLFAYAAASPHHERALAFVTAQGPREDVLVSELVLGELYVLLRNPAVLARPLTEQEAGGVIAAYRQHPTWRVAGFPSSGRALHDELWRRASQPQFARRRLYDLRLGLWLRAAGVEQFATANVRDFRDLGFARVWNPLEGE